MFWIESGVYTPGTSIFSLEYSAIENLNSLSSSTGEVSRTVTSGSFTNHGEYYPDGPCSYKDYQQRPALENKNQIS